MDEREFIENKIREEYGIIVKFEDAAEVDPHDTIYVQVNSLDPGAPSCLEDGFDDHLIVPYHDEQFICNRCLRVFEVLK